jgi:hypothetical protein
VALLHVANLVRQHRRQLGLVLRRDQELRVDADETARQRERVDHRVAHGEEEEIGIRLAARTGREGNQVFAEIVQVLDDGVIVEVVAVAPDVVHDLLAELALDDGRQVGARGIAQRRQAGIGRQALDRRGRRRQRARGGCGQESGREQGTQAFAWW